MATTYHCVLFRDPDDRTLEPMRPDEDGVLFMGHCPGSRAPVAIFSHHMRAYSAIKRSVKTAVGKCFESKWRDKSNYIVKRCEVVS